MARNERQAARAACALMAHCNVIAEHMSSMLETMELLLPAISDQSALSELGIRSRRSLPFATKDKGSS
jgi:hypothetical protein